MIFMECKDAGVFPPPFFFFPKKIEKTEKIHIEKHNKKKLENSGVLLSGWIKYKTISARRSLFSIIHI